MAMGRGLRAFQINPGHGQSSGYSVLLEQRGKNEVLMFENYSIATLGECVLTNFRILKKIVNEFFTFQELLNLNQ